MQRKRHALRRDERGAIAGLEGLAFGMLLFVFGLLVIINAWAVLDAKFATSAAAREAGRAYVESSNATAGSKAAAVAATDTLAGHHRSVSSLEIVTDGDDEAFVRCERVVASVTTDVYRIPIPLFHAVGGSYRVKSEHQEIVDPYRSGLAGSANC